MEIVLGTTRVAMVVECDHEGRPVAVRWPCKDPLCCPKVAGRVAIHRREFRGLPDVVGPETKEYQPRKSAAEMAQGKPVG